MSTPTLATPTTNRDEVELAVTGMTCGSCATRVQRVLAKRDGVDDAAVNFATAKATVRFATQSCGLVQSLTAMSTLSLTTAPNPSRSGEAVTVAVHVESAVAGSRGGEIVCTVGPLGVGRAAVSTGGDAVCTVLALACGQHAMVVTYSGDNLTSPSSGVTTHVVERSTTTMLLTVADGLGPVGADPTDARQDDRVRDLA